MFVVNVEGVMRKDNKWLIIERSKIEEYAGGLLSLVGGKVDKEGNSSDILERTVKREVWEEVGVRVKNNLKYIHSTSFTTDPGVNVINVVLCEYQSGKAFFKSSNKAEQPLWLTMKNY